MATGYAGLDNPLFHMNKTMMVLGDAKNTVEDTRTTFLRLPIWRTSSRNSGGNKTLRASKALGWTLYRDALQLLGISKIDSFHQLGRSLKVA